MSRLTIYQGLVLAIFSVAVLSASQVAKAASECTPMVPVPVHRDPVQTCSADTSIVEAINRNCAELVHQWLEQGGDPNLQWRDASVGIETLLLRAVSQGQVEIAKELLARGADPNFQSQYCKSYPGWTVCGGWYRFPLQLAVYRDDLELTDLLLKFGADPQMVGGFFPGTVIEAVKGNPQLLIRLMDSGLKASAKHLTDAVKNNQCDLVRELLKHGFPENKDLGSISYAIENENYELTKILMAAGADINHQTESSRSVPFFHASSVEMIRYLLDAGANVKVRDWSGSNALHYAHDADVLDVLVSRGAVLEEKNYDSDTPFLAFSRVWRPEEAWGYSVLDWFSRLPVDFKSKGWNGMTALHHAAKNTNLQLARFLLSKELSPNQLSHAPYETSASAFHLAVQGDEFQKSARPTQDYVGLTEAMLQAGASVNAPDSLGQTPLVLAALARWNWESGTSLALTQLLLGKKARTDILFRSRPGDPTKTLLGVFAQISAYSDPSTETAYLPIIELLLKSGAKPNLQDGSHLCALDYNPSARVKELLMRYHGRKCAKTER